MAIRSSRFDLPLTYLSGDLALQVGDVVRVPLGGRDVLGFVVAPARDEPQPSLKLRAVRERLDVPRAFDDVGLKLAQFVSERYLCTLNEALSAVTLATALPRTRELLRKDEGALAGLHAGTVPARFVAAIRENFPAAFGLDALLRHPEARRCGDRGQLLHWIGLLVQRRALVRERQTERPKLREYRVRRLEPGPATIAGAKAKALLAFVRAQPGVPRADAVLAGFSNAVIGRALRADAVREVASRPQPARPSAIPEAPFPPTDEQAAALVRISRLLADRHFAEVLLEGVTGSGKTYVYVEAIKTVVRAGGRAIVLVPEISLTPQTARRFERAFGERVAVLHSALSERERFDAFQACARGEVDVVVGARSAVFAPLRDVRLLVVDESHETSYKQDVSPRYGALEVARERMRIESGVLLLGSATPSIETFAAVRSGRLECLELRQRATGLALPRVHVVDLAQEFAGGNRRVLSGALVDALADRLTRGEKSVLFVNRRGSGGFVLCRACGAVPECPRCTVSLSVHGSEGLLRCHYCDYQRPLPQSCAVCGQAEMREFGIGTERVVADVQALFPQARVLRMDSDTTTHVGDHARLLDRFEDEGDVLVGTQMVAKGLDFEAVTLVGVVAADLSLHLPDFRAAERTFALIAQACGRSGRKRPGEAIVQTYAPAQPAIRFAAAHDFRAFAAAELAERVAAHFPPARRLIYLGVIGRSHERVRLVASRYADLMRDASFVEVLGPAPYPVARVNREWRYRVLLGTQRGRALRGLIRERILPLARADRTTRLAVAVDP